MYVYIFIPPVLYPFISQWTVQEGSPFNTSSPTLVSCVVNFTNLTGVRCYLIVVLICISLMMNDVKHIFMSLFGTGVSLEKCLFLSPAHLSTGLFVFECSV